MNKKFWVPLVLIGLFGTGLLSMSYLFTSNKPESQLSKIQEAQQDELNKIEINIPSRTLTILHSGRALKTYPVAVGRSKNLMTPIGDFKVETKDDKPGWTNPYNGKRIPPGNKNPLGTRWIGFLTKDGDIVYGIHGTNQPASIGKFISHGCVRMKIADSEELFENVQTGSPVKIRYERIEISEKNKAVLLTLYPDPYEMQALDVESVTLRIKEKYPKATIDTNKIARMLKKENHDRLQEVIGSLAQVS
jgi:L,D-transpeptidase ErfK/SrfK